MYGDANPADSLERLQEQSGGQIVDQTVGTFCREKVYSETLSAAAGEPVYVLHDFCDIRVPGNAKGNHRELVRKTLPDETEIVVNEFHMKKYGRAWDAFLRGEDLRPEGTLLEECEVIPKERLAHLKSVDIRTVEELAHVPDRSLQRIGHDGRALQRAAIGYLEEHDAGARAEAEVRDLKAELASMRAELALKEVGTDGDSQDSAAKRGSRNRSKSTS